MPACADGAVTSPVRSVTGWPQSKGRARAPAAVTGGAASTTKEVKMAQGTVKWFNGDKGYGFIAVGGPECSCTSA